MVLPKSVYLAAGDALAEYAIADDHPLTTFADLDESQDLDAQTPRNESELLTTKQPLISSYILKGDWNLQAVGFGVLQVIEKASVNHFVYGGTVVEG
nr:hypothetical protein [Tanacetum cinerariifolium]